MFYGSKRIEHLIIPLIICGGSGTRLWPASRDSRPKQFLPLFEALSTFQATVRRTSDPAPFEPPVVITNDKYYSLVTAQLDELNIRADIVLEPEARDSGLPYWRERCSLPKIEAIMPLSWRWQPTI